MKISQSYGHFSLAPNIPKSEIEEFSFRPLQIQCLQSSLAQDGGANHWQHCITDVQKALKTLIKSS